MSNGDDFLKANFHTHTYRCLHAFGTEENYVQAAVKAGLEQLGFSDHAPFPDRDFGLRMQFAELEEYLSVIDSLKDKYSIQLFKGLEIEYHPVYRDYYRELLDKYKLDYLILGEHMYTMPDGEIKNIYFAESTEDYLYYADAIAQAAQTDCFSVIAHPDLMLKNHFAWDENCRKASRQIIDSAKKHNMVLEFNANGFRKGLQPFPDGQRYPYPDKRFWDMVKDTDIRVIVGSDCHSPEQVWDSDMEYACRTARQYGLNVIETIF